MGEFLEGDGETAAEAALQTDAAGVGLALDRARARRGGKGDAAADRFLAAQEALIADQRAHLREQFRNLGLDRWSKRLRLAFQALTIAAGLFVLSFLAGLVWDAAHADGLVVEAFSVPPSLAAQGSTGAVVAGDVLDQLAGIEAQAKSFYSSKVSDAWTAGSRIEVPETGLTLDEIERLFRRQFGHETHITGQVQFTPAGLALTARTGPGAAVRVEGPADQLPALTKQLAEAIHAKARPMNHALYAAQLGRWDEVRVLAEEVLADPKAASVDKTRAHIQMGSVLGREGRWDEARVQLRLAAAAGFDVMSSTAYNNLANLEETQGHLGRARDLYLASARAMTRANVDRSAADARGHLEKMNLLQLAGDYAGARAAIAPLVGVKVEAMNSLDLQHNNYGGLSAALHEVSLAHAHAPRSPAAIAVIAEDWQAYLDARDAVRARNPDRIWTPTAIANEATALAHAGRVKEAQAEIAPTPLDCSSCLIARGDVAEAAGDGAGADRWYVAADKADPGFPFADQAWGRTQFARGQYDLALARFAAAHKSQPHWADPEAWAGRALALKGDPAAAVAHYAEAVKFAPRWGGLHLWWGEALGKLGRKAEAQAQFAAAAGLDLSPAERAELAAQKL